MVWGLFVFYTQTKLPKAGGGSSVTSRELSWLKMETYMVVMSTELRQGWLIIPQGPSYKQDR